MTEKKSEKFSLQWLCPLTGRKHPAGVAFFNEEQGDYRLKVDVMPDDKVLYLKKFTPWLMEKCFTVLSRQFVKADA